MPLAYWLGRLCEEFPALTPTRAYREWMTVPVGWFEEIIEARAYARAKQQYDTAKSKSDLPDTPMVQLVAAIEFTLAQAARTE